VWSELDAYAPLVVKHRGGAAGDEIGPPREIALPSLAGEFFIGRARDCGMPVDDAGMSRRHFLLARRGGGVFLQNVSDRKGCAGT
jgi:hypothetical protein